MQAAAQTEENNGDLSSPSLSPSGSLLTGLSCPVPGDNILAVLRYLLMSEKLADSSEYRHGNMVFFDVLGLFVVAYPARVGTILNYVVAAATFLYLAKKASQPGNSGRRLPPLLTPPSNFLCFLFEALSKSPCLVTYVVSPVPRVSLPQVAVMSGTWPGPRAWLF